MNPFQYQYAMTVVNPFITQGYLSPHYFCDRIEETKYLGALKPVGQVPVTMTH